MFDENLRNQFINKHEFSRYNFNKLLLLLRKSVFPHEHKDDWKKLCEASSP